MKLKSRYLLLIALILFAIGWKWSSLNLDKIYSYQADWCFKNNNLQKAQLYYEKAFQKGLDNQQAKEKYINSIINSPLSIEAQEKLFVYLQNFGNDDVLSYKIKSFLQDIRREIYNKYYDNYIIYAVYNQKIMRWGSFPITYSIEKVNEIPVYYYDEFNNAFETWAKALDNKNMFRQVNSDGNIKIKFAKLATQEDGQKYVVAYTVPFVDQDKLEKMEITFGISDDEKKLLTKEQVYNIALHEICHALGFMGHSQSNDDIMYLSRNSNPEMDKTRAVLSDTDINTIRLLYKIKPSITNVENPFAEYIPYIALGSDLDVTTEKIKEAKNYINKASNLSAGYIDLAEGYVAINDYSKALKYLSIALDRAESREVEGMIYFNLAVVNFYMDKFNEAKDCIKKSMYIKETNEKKYLLAEIYLKEGNSQEAINIYKNLIANEPENIEYVISLVNIYVIQKDYLQARKVLKTFFEANPNEKNNSRLNPYGILKLGL